MYLLKDFIYHHSREDLLILAFFITVGATVIGWIIDVVMRDRGFGVIGNGLLIFLGALSGALVAQMIGSIPSIPETHRIMLFSASTSALILVFFCTVKSWISVT